jgi:protein-tyrosine sulfotransferase
MSIGKVRRLLLHLPVALGGRPLRGKERYRPFFIVGSGRSGTTLLRAMLEAHPDLHIPPENPLESLVRDYRRYSRLPWSVVLRIVLAELEFHATWERWELSLGPLFRELKASPRSARNLAAVLDALYRAHGRVHKPSATRWGDKTPPNTVMLPTLRALFPDLQVVHLVRDGRDVVQSFMRESQAGLTYFAHWWVRTVCIAQAFGAHHPAQYLEVRYEDLARHPNATLQQITSFLGVSPDQRMLRYHELGQKLGDVERYPGLQGVWKPVHRESIGKWRTAFDAHQLAELDRVIGSTLEHLGYGANQSRGVE